MHYLKQHSNCTDATNASHFMHMKSCAYPNYKHQSLRSATQNDCHLQMPYDSSQRKAHDFHWVLSYRSLFLCKCSHTKLIKKKNQPERSVSNKSCVHLRENKSTNVEWSSRGRLWNKIATQKNYMKHHSRYNINSEWYILCECRWVCLMVTEYYFIQADVFVLSTLHVNGPRFILNLISMMRCVSS